MMFRRTSFWPPRAHSRHLRLHLLRDGPVRLRRQLHQRVQRDIHPGRLVLRDVHEVCIDASYDGLVRDDEDVFGAFEFHDDGFETDDDVAVGFAAAVPVVVFVFVAGREVVGVFGFDFSVGEAVADAGVEFIQSFPLQFFPA